MKRLLIILLFAQVLFTPSMAQQFVTDNYLAMPHGTETVVLTTGQRSANITTSFSLIRNWEFFAQANLFWAVVDQEIPQHFTASVFSKWMFWENQNKNGGGAFFLGYGKSPSYWQNTEFLEERKNVWSSFSFTFPLFNNFISWDIMPGVILDWGDNFEINSVWSFTYASRIAVYKIIPKSAIVFETYGSEGEAFSPPEYKVGIRWEPNETIVPALTYSGRFDGSRGARIEIGVMIFSPRFLRKQTDKPSTI